MSIKKVIAIFRPAKWMQIDYSLVSRLSTREVSLTSFKILLGCAKSAWLWLWYIWWQYTEDYIGWNDFLPLLLTGHIEVICDTDESLEDTDTEQDQGEEGDQEEKDNSLMLYTFVTVGLLLLLVVIVLVHLVAIMRCLQSRRRDTPLLSEEEQISILKQIGYLNPTYQFFDQSTKAY